MKTKLTSLLLCLLLLAGLRLPAAAAGTKYVVTAKSANVLPTPAADTRALAVLAQGDVVYAEKTESGFARITLASTGITGWVALSDLTFAGAEAQNTQGVTRIYVKTMPKKTAYIEGEEPFDPAGLEIWAAYAGKPDAKIAGYALYLPTFSVYGLKTVQVAYTAPGGAVFGTSFTVNVAKVPVQKVEIVSLPKKTSYIEGEALDLTGLTLRVSYSDGRAAKTFTAAEALRDPDFTLMGCHSEAPGKALVYGSHTLTFYYKYPEIHCALTLTAREKKLTALSVATPPKSTVTYSNAAPPDLTGLTLKAEYDNGLSETVLPARCTVTCDPAAFVLGPGNKVQVSFGGKTVTLEFTYALDGVKDISVLLPGEHTFILGEKIDLTGLIVYENTVSGKQRQITDYTLGAIDPARPGNQTVTVTHGAYVSLLDLVISPYYQKGDADGNGKVNAADARIVLRAAVKLQTLANNPLRAADADGNGKVQAADARKILRAAVKLETLLDFTNIVVLPKTTGGKG